MAGAMMRAGTPRASSLGPRSPIGVGDRLRGDDEEGALQAIFIVVTEKGWEDEVGSLDLVSMCLYI